MGLKLAAPSALILLLGCGTASLYGDGHERFEGANTWLLFAPCTYAEEAVPEHTAHRWESCHGPHSPSEMEHREYRAPMTLEQVRADFEASERLGDVDQKAEEPEGAKYKGMTYTQVRVEYRNNASLLGVATYASDGGKHGYYCYIDANMLDDRRDSALRGKLNAYCDDGIDSMASVVVGKKP